MAQKSTFKIRVSRDIVIKQYGEISVRAKDIDEAVDMLQRGAVSDQEVEWHEIEIPSDYQTIKSYL